MKLDELIDDGWLDYGDYGNRLEILKKGEDRILYDKKYEKIYHTYLFKVEKRGVDDGN
jgi:hypothetical protein